MSFDLERIRADHHSPRSYLVRHVTRYEYDAPRVAAYEFGRLTPRATSTQRVRSTATRLEPAPLVRTEHVDRYGNLAEYIEVRRPTPCSSSRRSRSSTCTGRRPISTR